MDEGKAHSHLTVALPSFFYVPNGLVRQLVIVFMTQRLEDASLWPSNLVGGEFDSNNGFPELH